MVGGLAVLAVAASTVGGIAPGRGPVVGQVAAIAGDPLAIRVSARDVSVVVQSDEPGQASGWHAHSRIHAVAVLSGVLTIYDEDCRPETFAPGRPHGRVHRGLSAFLTGDAAGRIGPLAGGDPLGAGPWWSAQSQAARDVAVDLILHPSDIEARAEETPVHAVTMPDLRVIEPGA